MAHNCFLPGPNPEIAEAMGWIMPELEAFDADGDGINLMECQRRDRQDPFGFCVGGFIQRTDITKMSITSRIVKWWPDSVGGHIKPAPDFARARLYGLIAGATAVYLDIIAIATDL